MTSAALSNRVNALFRREQWAKARKLLDAALIKEPDCHWLITQRGVTLYEQRRYAEALPVFQESLKIVDDCPLTLWNLAGTLDALGRPAEAVPIFAWLLASTVSPDDDPCWESDDWANTLKADSLYCLGLCCRHLDQPAAAEQCFREYVNLLLSGIEGIYSITDVRKQLHELKADADPAGDLRKAVRVALKASGSPRRRPDLSTLLPA